MGCDEGNWNMQENCSAVAWKVDHTWSFNQAEIGTESSSVWNMHKASASSESGYLLFKKKPWRFFLNQEKRNSTLGNAALILQLLQGYELYLEVGLVIFFFCKL